MAVHDKIKQFRKARALSLAALGSLCGLSKGYLSKVESGRQAPPISTLQTIATALGADVSELIETHPADSRSTPNLDLVLASAQSHRAIISRAGYTYQPLLHRFRDKYMAPFLMRVRKGKTSAFHHDAEEFTYVVSGSVRFQYEGKMHRLKPGDSVYFDARIPHCFENSAAKDAVLLTVHYSYRRF